MDLVWQMTHKNNIFFIVLYPDRPVLTDCPLIRFLQCYLSCVSYSDSPVFFRVFPYAVYLHVPLFSFGSRSSHHKRQYFTPGFQFLYALRDCANANGFLQ